MNRAKRILDIYDTLIAQGAPQGMAAADCWAKALGIEVAKGADRDDSLVISMRAFQDELDVLGVQLATAGFQNGLYAAQLKRLRIAAAASTMNGTWNGMVGSVSSPEVRLALQWSEAVLPDDEGVIPTDQLEALAATLDQLQGELAGACLPPVMGAYASKQLHNLRDALRMYRVRGAEPLSEAVQTAYGATAFMKDKMAAEMSTAEPVARSYMQRVGGALTRAVMVCKDIDALHKGGGAMVSMAEKLQLAFEVFNAA